MTNKNFLTFFDVGKTAIRGSSFNKETKKVENHIELQIENNQLNNLSNEEELIENLIFNLEKKEFKGTGGGTYTTINGKYSEKIEFFSRDNSRVGMNLEFNYDIDKGNWIHKGKTSKGDPLHEIWVKRKK